MHPGIQEPTHRKSHRVVFILVCLAFLLSSQLLYEGAFKTLPSTGTTQSFLTGISPTDFSSKVEERHEDNSQESFLQNVKPSQTFESSIIADRISTSPFDDVSSLSNSPTLPKHDEIPPDDSNDKVPQSSISLSESVPQSYESNSDAQYPEPSLLKTADASVLADTAGILNNSHDTGDAGETIHNSIVEKTASPAVIEESPNSGNISEALRMPEIKLAPILSTEDETINSTPIVGAGPDGSTISLQGTTQNEGLDNDSPVTLTNALSSMFDNHNTTILPLLPWELNSINFVKKKKWQLPSNVESNCALGVIPKSSIMKPADFCRNVTNYERLQDEVKKVVPEDGICDVCRIVDLLVQYNQTLTFWGDALQLQVFNGFHCELERRQYTVTSEKEKLGKLIEKMTYIHTLKVHVLRPCHDDPMNSSICNNTATIKYYSQFKTKMDVDLVKEESLSRILDGAESQILFFNFGINWDHLAKVDYRNAMTATFGALQQSFRERIPLMVFRESTMQHYKTRYGEYISPMGEKPYFCRPLHMDDPALSRFDWDWRDKIAHEEAIENGFTWVVVEPAAPVDSMPAWREGGIPEIVVAPYRDFISGMYYMHPDECTHFCHSPHLWNPLWRSLRLAMERRFDPPDKE